MDRLSKIRANVLNVLRYGDLVPFGWTTNGFKCFYCRKLMKDCDALKEHTKTHNSVDLNTFIPKRIITKDIPVKMDVKNLSCKVCTDTPLQNLQDLIDHISGTHNEVYNDDTGVCVLPFELNRDVMNCVLCESSFDNFTTIINHMHKEHVVHSCVCQFCGLSFMTKVRLKRHIKSSHVGYPCTVCKKVFHAPHILAKHKARVHGQAKSYECNLCSATFESNYQVKVHLGKVHNVERYTIRCKYCPKVCTTKGALALHVKSKHSGGEFRCDLCDYKSGIQWLVTLHKRKHNDERDYGCTICERLFRRSSNLRAHMKVHTGFTGRVCRVCRKGFSDLETLKRHEMEVHSYDDWEPRGGQKTTKRPRATTHDDDINQRINAKNTLTAKGKRAIMRSNVLQVLIKSTVMPFRWLKSSYRCFYCYDIFQEPSELKNHQLVHSEDGVKEQAMSNYWEPVVYVDVSNLSCKLCPETIMDLYDLIDHLVAKHDVTYNKDVGICMVAFKLDNLNVGCVVCGASFYTFGPLLHHTNKDHKGTSAILCDVCGQHFKDATLLRLHVKTVHENTGLLCTECGEKFDTRSKLKTHQKNQHELEKKYKCLNCSLTFESHYKRWKHMAAEHKNRQEIKCLHCPKTFVFRSMMMTHFRDTHLKVRNHICGVCGWKAFNSNRLKNHMYKHSGEKNFKCDACDKAFTTKKIMRAHFARMHKVQTSMQYENLFAQ